MLESPQYSIFADDFPEMMRTTYDGFVVIEECLGREGFSSPGQQTPTFEEWMSSGRTWSPYSDLVKAGDVDQLDVASQKCKPT